MSLETPTDPSPTRPKRYSIGPIHVPEELHQQLEAKRGDLSKQKMGREAFRLWLRGDQAPAAALGDPPLVWWLSDRVRTGPRPPLLPEAPIYLHDGVKEAMTTLSRPRAQVWNHAGLVSMCSTCGYHRPAKVERPKRHGQVPCRRQPSPDQPACSGTLDLALPSLEAAMGTNPVARWLHDEAAAGLVVLGHDSHYLKRMPGIITTLKLEQVLS